MPVSIVMPCYNESEIIEQVIRQYYSEIILKIRNSEFIVIDDCSQDDTPAILRKLASEFQELKILTTPYNGGHGKAIRLGYATAQKEWIFQVDSDNQFEIKDFWKLYALKDSYPLLLGFRAKRDDYLERLALTKIIRFFNYLFFGTWISDANCAFRLINKDFVKKLLPLIDEQLVAPNIVISILAKKKNLLKEIPVEYHRENSKHSLLQHWELIKFTFRGFIQLIKFKKIYSGF